MKLIRIEYLLDHKKISDSLCAIFKESFVILEEGDLACLMENWLKYLILKFGNRSYESIDTNDQSDILDVVSKIGKLESSEKYPRLQLNFIKLLAIVSDWSVGVTNKKLRKFNQLSLTEKKISIYTTEEVSFEDEVESAWSDLFLSSTQLCLQLTIDNEFDQSNSAEYAEGDLIRLKLSQVCQFDLNPWSDRDGVPDPSTAEPVDDELIRNEIFNLEKHATIFNTRMIDNLAGMFHLAVENKFNFDLSGEIYSTLLDGIGLMDQKLSFLILQQLQNVKAAHYFRNLLQKSSSSANGSRLRKILSDTTLSKSFGEDASQILDDFPILENLSLSQLQPNFLSNLPYPVLILHHEGDYIYFGFVNGNKTIKVNRIRYDKILHDDIIKAKIDLSQKLLSNALKKSYDIEREAQRTRIGTVSGDGAFTTGGASGPTSRASHLSIGQEQSRIQSRATSVENYTIEFEQLTNLIEEYFATFVEKLPDIVDLPEKSILLIIGDAFFLDLPLEAVSWFKSFQLCRDFSTQLHQNRADRFGKENSIPKGKMIGIADNTENKQMISEVSTTAKTGWKMASPESTGEIKSLLSDGQIGMVTVSELRCGVLLNPSNIANSDYRNVQIGIILDKSPEPASFIFQNKLDVKKNSIELGLGTNFIDYMALLSLAGFGALCGNQFHSVKGVNRFRLQEIATALGEKKSIVEANQILRTNYIEPEAETPNPSKGKPKLGKGKSAQADKMKLTLTEEEKICSTVFGLPLSFIT